MSTPRSSGAALPRPVAARVDAAVDGPQLAAVQEWRLLREEEALAPDRRVTRAGHLDVARRDDALRRETDALYDRLVLPRQATPSRATAVVVHRMEFLRERLQVALSARGIDVIGEAEDGASGSGIAIALRPTVLLLEAQLPSMTGVEVTRRVSRCCPTTIVAAQVPHLDDRAPLLAAGATQVWSRHVLPVVIAADIAALLEPEG